MLDITFGLSSRNLLTKSLLSIGQFVSVQQARHREWSVHFSLERHVLRFGKLSAVCRHEERDPK